MNDNTSNTPDNASRPGNAPHPASRVRDKSGRFLPKRRNADTPGSVEEARAWPLVGSNNKTTVEEVFDAAREREAERARLLEVMNEPVIEHKVKPTRIGQHVDVENKESLSHTRRPKKRRESDGKGQPPLTDNRRTMLYQIRTLPNKRGFGLYYADGVEYNDPSRGNKDIIKHWLGENWYQAFDDGAAKIFTTSDEARKFRREHFNVTVDDRRVCDRRKARHSGQKVFREVFREIGASLRHPSHTTKNKTERKPRKPVRDDLVKLYKLIGRTQ